MASLILFAVVLLSGTALCQDEVYDFGLNLQLEPTRDAELSDRFGLSIFRLNIVGPSVVPSVLMNGPQSSSFTTTEGDSIDYQASTGRLSFISGGEIQTAQLSQGFQFFFLNRTSGFFLHEFTGSDFNLPGDQSSAGVVYLDGDRALFSNFADFNGQYSFIQQQLPTSIELSFPRQSNELILSFSSIPMTPSDGDIMELTGHQTTIIEAGETLLYRSNTIQHRRGSVSQNTFFGITRFYEVLDDEVGIFTSDSPDIFTGPGILRIGNFQGEMVAVFSSSGAINMEINAGVVDNQIGITVEPDMNRAILQNVFVAEGAPPTPLVNLVGAGEFTFPSARQGNFQSGELTLFDANGRQVGFLRGLDLGFAAFVNHEIVTPSGTFDIPEGGLTLYVNALDPSNPQLGLMGFGYPTRNSLITMRITDALSEFDVPGPQAGSFRIRSTPDGGAVLIANGEQEVTVTDNPPIAVQGGQFIRYDGSNVMIYDGGDPDRNPISNTPIMMVNTFSLDIPGLNFYTFDSMNTPNGDFSGPGLLYYDNQGRSIYTARPSTMNLISGFIASRPPPQINAMRRPGTTNIVDVTNAGRRLVEISSMTTTQTPTATQGVLYTDSTVRTVNGFVVPGDARVVTTVGMAPGTQRVQVLSPTNEILFSLDSSPSFNVRFMGMVSQPPVNQTFNGGGTLYFDPAMQTVLYNSGGTGASSNLVAELINSNIPFPSQTFDIEELNFFDGMRVTQFSGTAGMFLGGPGTLFTTGNQSYYSQDVNGNRQLMGEISRLIPVSIGGNTTTGVVDVTSGTGVSVYNFTIGTTRDINVGETRTVTYTGGVVMLPGQNITTDRFTYFNGFEVQTFGPDDMVTFSGPGRITMVEGFGVVYNTDQRSINSITSFVERVPVISPRLVRPTGDIRSPDGITNARFGQEVIVYNGTFVFLECEDTRGAPSPEFTFFRNGRPLNFTDDTDLSRPTIVEETPSSATLMFTANANNTYTCRARNIAGRDQQTSSVTTLIPDRGPVVINDFKPFSKTLPGRVVTAQETARAVDTTVIIRRESTNPELRINENFIFDDLINVACKIDSLPSAILEFNANTVPAMGADSVRVNGTTTILGPGQGVFTINLTDLYSQGGQDILNILVNCVGTTNEVESNAQILLLAEAYVCESIDTTSGECSASCGLGIREITPTDCSRTAGGVTTPNIPPEEVPRGLYEPIFDFCDAGDCPPVITFEFANSDMFGACSRTCGTGVQLTTIVCYQLSDGVRNVTVDDQNCIDVNSTVPQQIMRECEFDRCPRWVYDDYSPCSSTCNGGTQTRNVVCMQQIFSYNDTDTDRLERLCDDEGNFIMNDTVVNDALCNMDLRPPAMRPCNVDVACPHRWYPEAWGPCAADFCQERTLTCTRYEVTDPKERWVINDTFCEGLAEPPVVRSCGGGVCSRGRWVVISTSPCSVTCGVGLADRVIECQINGQGVNPGFCNYRGRPRDQERCILFNCPGRCDMEPQICPLYQRFRLCKQRPAFVEQCCRSCPLQMLPIVLPRLITRENIALDLNPDNLNFVAGQDVTRLCCDATEAGGDPTDPAFLNFLADCTFDVEFADGRESVSEQTQVGRTLGPRGMIENMACVMVPTPGLLVGDTVEVALTSSFAMEPVSRNITVVAP